MGEIIRKKHNKNKEEVKEILINEINKTEYSSLVEWNGYHFHASQLFISVDGEITDEEIIAEFSGLGSGKVAKKLEKILDTII
jgi:hypothetical protein